MDARLAAIETTANLTAYEIPGSPYQLRRPLTVEIERDEAGFVVSEPGTGVFHYDIDFGSAISGFLRVFVDEYEYLRGHREHLSDPLNEELDRFEHMLKPMPVPA
jgi:hypothetical protein